MADDRTARPTWIDENLPREIAESSLFRFRVSLSNENKVSVDLRTNISIDYEDLETELTDTPSQYVFWSTVYSEVRATVAIIERRIKAMRGEITSEFIKEARAQGVKLTDNQIKALVEQDAKLSKLEERLIEVQRDCGKLYHMVRALEMKSEHLRSLSGFKRQEREQQR